MIKSDRQVWANSADPDQTAPDQGLHYSQFPLHLLDTLPYGKGTLFEFWADDSKFFWCLNF